MTSPDIFAFLTGDSAVAALVETRVYPGILSEQATRPALSYQVVSQVEDQTLLGPHSGLPQMRIQVDCWANSYEGVVALALAVMERFDGYQGDMGDSQVSTTSRLNMIDIFEPSRRDYRRVLDFMVVFN